MITDDSFSCCTHIKLWVKQPVRIAGFALTGYFLRLLVKVSIYWAKNRQPVRHTGCYIVWLVLSKQQQTKKWSTVLLLAREGMCVCVHMCVCGVYVCVCVCGGGHVCVCVSKCVCVWCGGVCVRMWGGVGCVCDSVSVFAGALLILILVTELW